MTSTMRCKTCMTAALVILVTAVASPADEKQQVVFKGTFQGKDSINPPTITTSATGHGTHIAKFKLIEETNLASAPPAGSAHIQSDKGDSIDSTFIVVSFQVNTPAGYATILESHTVTGGTGDFAGAEGSFTLERLHTLAANADGTHDIFGSFQGSITRAHRGERDHHRDD